VWNIKIYTYFARVSAKMKETNMNKNLLTVAFLLTAAILFSACRAELNKTEPVTTTTANGTTTAPPASEVKKRDNALVRVLNANNNLGTVDVYAGDQKAFEKVGFKATTAFVELPGKRTDFKVRVAGMDTSPFVAENSEGLDDGKHYTVIILPGDDNRRSDIQVLEDDLKIPANGNARVRIVHAVRDGGDIEIFAVGGKPGAMFDDVSFQEEEGYDDVDPFTGSLEVRPEGKPQAIYTIENVKFEANKAYTLVIGGRMAPPKEKSEIESVIVEDKLGN